MIENPHRWIEAIQNRREYIAEQLAGGRPVVALSVEDGILVAAITEERPKIFEIYDRIAMAAMGHPADVERLRAQALEVCSAEGFARSPDDVSLRRLLHYSLSPILKAGFENVYGAPLLLRVLWAEVAQERTEDSLVILDYDGAMPEEGLVHGPFRGAVLCSTNDQEKRATRIFQERLEKADETNLRGERAIDFLQGVLAAARLEEDVPDAEDFGPQAIQAWRSKYPSEKMDVILLQRKPQVGRVAYLRLPDSANTLSPRKS
ncbi:MAG: hypothetical protein ACFCU3_07820 [Verrucomicrobiales bacterium]